MIRRDVYLAIRNNDYDAIVDIITHHGGLETVKMNDWIVSKLVVGIGNLKMIRYFTHLGCRTLIAAIIFKKWEIAKFIISLEYDMPDWKLEVAMIKSADMKATDIIDMIISKYPGILTRMNKFNMLEYKSLNKYAGIPQVLCEQSIVLPDYTGKVKGWFNFSM